MFVAGVNREDFLGVVQGDKLPPPGIRECDYVDQTSYSGDMLLLWSEKPTEDMLPSAVVLQKGDVKDFLAWVATYLNNLRPFTAFCRVTDLETAQQFTGPRKQSLSKQLHPALLGMILSEAALHVGETGTGRNLTIRTCMATASYVMAKSLLLGLGGAGAERGIAGWVRSRQLTQEQRLRIPIEDLRKPWMVILGLADRDAPTYSPDIAGLPAGILQICRDLNEQGTVSQYSWQGLEYDFRDILGLFQHSQDTREQRVVRIESIISDLPALRERDKTVAAFVAGYLVSQVAPGTLDHLSLLNRVVQSMPSAYLWYGLCAGLPRPNSVANFGEGLGRRIVRELFRAEGFLDKPKCDIALEELELVKGDLGVLRFRTSTVGFLEVEVGPCVVTTMRVDHRQAGGGNTELFPTQTVSPEMLDTIRELERVSDRLTTVVDRLAQAAHLPQKKNRKR